MHCETIRAGADCIFMSRAGCSFNGGSCYAVVEECEGCARIVQHNGNRYCGSYPDPASKWAMGSCNFATHVKREMAVEQSKLNPLKASKRKMGR